MSDEERLAEYRICQRRGHQPSGEAWTAGWRTWDRCKWCGTSYWIETTKTVHEGDPPPYEPQGR